jgi:hypothetical protein
MHEKIAGEQWHIASDGTAILPTARQAIEWQKTLDPSNCQMFRHPLFVTRTRVQRIPVVVYIFIFLPSRGANRRVTILRLKQGSAIPRTKMVFPQPSKCH